MAQLSLPISPADCLQHVISPALKLLPANMDSVQARVMLLAIALQESSLAHRWQVIDPSDRNRKGPARGLWQFEQGTQASRGGVWGVYLHYASKDHLKDLCAARGVTFEPTAIYKAVEQDDIFAAGVARLLLWTDRKALPALGDSERAWDLYYRTWQPGKPHPGKWPSLYSRALREVR